MRPVSDVQAAILARLERGPASVVELNPYRMRDPRVIKRALRRLEARGLVVLDRGVNPHRDRVEAARARGETTHCPGNTLEPIIIARLA